MNMQTKQESCNGIVRLVDKSRKVLQYQVEGRISNEEGLDREMKMWITELGNTDLIIERDWLRSMKLVID